MDKRRCSPIAAKRAKKDKFQSCFSWQSLAYLAKNYNKYNPHDKIPIYRTRDQLWNAIKKKIPECSDEKCWINSRFLSNADKTYLLEDFKPPIPKGKYKWLETDDIDVVLSGYQKAFSLFQYLGAHPIDFETYNSRFHPLSELQRAKRAGKHAAAIVLNLDMSYDPGSHWVAIFFDLKHKTMEYFDSYGYQAPKRVMDFYDKLPIGWTLKRNKKQHQHQNSECGVYSIHFIVRRLLGQSFEQTVNNVIADAKMNEFRKEYFDEKDVKNV